MRQTIKEVELNLPYRWFLVLSLTDKVTHFSTFCKNYARRFREPDLFEQIFIIILEQAVEARFIHEEILYMDSTHIKANYYVKNEREKQFAYSAHTVCDENGFALDVMATPGNLNDSRMFVTQVERAKARGFSFM